MPAGSFLSLTVVGGAATLTADDATIDIRQGETILVPAETKHVALDGNATILTASIPSEK